MRSDEVSVYVKPPSNLPPKADAGPVSCIDILMIFFAFCMESAAPAPLANLSNLNTTRCYENILNLTNQKYS